MSKSSTKKWKLLRRIISIILAAAMELTCLPQMSLVAKADISSTGLEEMFLPPTFEYDTHNVTDATKSAIALQRVGPYSGKYGDKPAFGIDLLNKQLRKTGTLGLVELTDGGMASAAKIGDGIINGKALDPGGTTDIGSNVSVTMNYLGLERSNIIRVGYVINNNSDSAKTVTLGGVTDLYVALDNSATITTFESEYYAGLWSTAKNGAFISFATDGNFWYGEATKTMDNSDVYTWFIAKADGRHGTEVTKPTGTYDSAMSWLWKSVNVPANSSVTKYCYFGVGALTSGESPEMIMTAGSPAYITWNENIPWGMTQARGIPSYGISAVDRDGNITLIPVTRYGYVFDGWYDKAAGGNKIGDPGDIYHTEDNVTLYAHWHAVVSNVVIDLKMDEDPYDEQIVQLYDSKGLKYTLKESTSSPGTYSVDGVENGTYDVVVSGVRTGDTIIVSADGNDSTTWIKNVTVTLKKVAITTKLDGSLSSTPGEVTLRQNGRIVYTVKKRAAGTYVMGVVMGSDTSFDVFVGDMDTGVDVTLDASAHTIDYHTATVTITDVAPWDDAEVLLKNPAGKMVAKLPNTGTEGNTTTYGKILQDSEVPYKVEIDGIDSNKQLTIGTSNSADLSFYTATLNVNCTDGTNLPLVATLKSADGARRYTLKKGTPAASAVAYTAAHVLNDGAYTLYISSVSGADPNGYAISSADPQKTIDVYVVDYKEYSTTDNENFSVASSGIKDYVVSGGKASLPEMYLAGYTFDGWSTDAWSRNEDGYSKFADTTAITENKTLYPHYLSATVKINGFTITDATGAAAENGGYYTMPNLTIAGFDTGEQSIKYVVFNGTNVAGITALDQAENGANFDPSTSILTFDPAVSMTAARDYVREKIIVEPSKNNDSTHKDGSMNVVVIDKNGTAAVSSSGTPSASVTASAMPTSAGSTLANGNLYLVNSSTTITGSSSASTARARSGLIVADGATVYLYIKSGVTLTVKGAAASNGGNGSTGQTYNKSSSPTSSNTGNGGSGGVGAGAGIYVPSGAKLYIMGDGSLNATGGKAGNGGAGGAAGRSNAYRETTISHASTDGAGKWGRPYYASVEPGYTTGGGGGGGAGGGGAGAGIGGAGGTGGAGGKGGKAKVYSSQDATAGSNGTAGSSGTACGTIYNLIGSRLAASGGAAGSSNGTGGAVGSTEYSKASASGGNWDKTYTDYIYSNARGSSAAAGGGGGGNGIASVDIGSGGGGGGGAGGGGAGAGVTQSNIDSCAAGGGSGGVGSGGASGATGGGTKGTNGNALAGGTGGAAGAASTAVAPSTSFTYTITCTKAADTDTLGSYTTSYTPGTELSFQFPTYTPSDSGVVIKGWMITKYGIDVNGSTSNSFATASDAVYPAGSTATIPAGTLGNLQFSPVTFAKSGLVAEDTLAYNGTNRSMKIYTVNTLVDGVPADVGVLTFGTESVRGLNGVYSVGSTETGYTVKFKSSTIAELTEGNPEATVSFEKITVQVTGKEPSIVTLSEGGPALTCTGRDDTNKVYIYESGYRVVQDNKGNYPISVDGEYTGITASYGADTAEVKYHTITISLSPSDAEVVTLQDQNGNVLVMEKTGSAPDTVFTYTSLHDEDTAYDVYADGTKTTASGDNAVKFDGNTGSVSVGYYVTTVTVQLDNAASDVPGIPYFGSNPMIRKAAGEYAYASASSQAQAVTVRGKTAVSSLAAGGTGTIDFYTVTYSGSGETGETGTPPEPTYCLKDTATELAFSTLECGAMIFGGWDIGGTIYPAGSSISINEAKTATATWSAYSLDGLTTDGKCGTIVFNNDIFGYDGTEQKPAIEVYMGDTLLTLDSDYTLSFSNDNTDTGAGDTCVRTGTVTVTATGKGSYSGSLTKDYTILKRVVSIDNITAVDRAFDGTGDVALSTSSVTLTGVADADNNHSKLWFDGTLKGTVNDANVETVETTDPGSQDVVVTVNGINYIKKDVKLNTGAGVTLTGTSSSNYVLSNIGGAYNSTTQKNDPVRVLITKKEIMPSSIGVHDKAYDGTTAAEIIEGSAVFDSSDVPDDVKEKLTVRGHAEFADENVGDSKTVNITGLTLEGPAAGNYVLTSTSMFSTANIVKAARLAPAPGEGYEIENGQIKVGSSTDTFTDGKDYEILWVHNNPTEGMSDGEKSGTAAPGTTMDIDPDKTYYIRIQGDGMYEPSPYTKVVTDVPEGKKIASLPTAVEGLVYNGNVQTGVRAGDGYTLTGNTGTDVGDYIATATLSDGYVWPDKTAADLKINWTISKRSQDTPANVYADTLDNKNVIRYPYPTQNGQVLSYSPDGGKNWYTLPSGIPGETLKHSSDGGKTWTDTGEDPDNMLHGTLQGVSDNTTYMFRYIEDEHNYASPASFVTVGSKIIIPDTLTPTDLSSTGVKLRGSVENTTGVSGVGFKYRKTGDSDWTEITGTVDVTFAKSITGLEPDTDYEYCAFTTVTSAVNTGNIVRFHTLETEAVETGEITVSVSNQTGNIITAEVTVEYGNDVIATTTTQTIVNGKAQSVSFKNLPYGYYNVVVRAGDYTETRMLSVESDIAVSAAFTIPKGKLSTLVVINDSQIAGADTPKVAVEGLNDIITDSDKNSAAVGQSDVEVKLVVEKNGTATAGANAIRRIAGRDTLVSFIDMSLFKTITRRNASGEPISVDEQDIGGSNKKVLEIAIPVGNLAEKPLNMYRNHGSVAQKLEKLNNRPLGGVFKDGTFYRDPTGWIFLYASGFSTYAIAYPQESSGGGGGAAPAPDYTPVIVKPEHGIISINPEKPEAEDIVIISVTPDENYEVDSVTVKDKDGNNIEVIKYEDGIYAFKQPASGAVSISANILAKETVKVFFDLNGKEGYAPDTQGVVKGGKAVRPIPDPTAKDYNFIGWFTDKGCTKVYDFDTPVEEDMTLYAGWQKKSEEEEEDEDFGIYFTELFDDPYEGVHYNAEKDRYEIVYTGSAIKPLIRVTSKADGMLKEGIDYSISYSNNKNYSKKKPATIKVSGKGFYKSKKVLELYILPADLSKAKDEGLLAIPDELNVKKGNKAVPTMVYRGYKLKSKDYTLSNKKKITQDTSITITGKGNFTGSLTDVPVKVMTSETAKSKTIKVKVKAGKHVYNGSAQELTVTTAEAAGELTVTAGSSKIPLEEGKDFIVTYSRNVNTGTAKVIVTGIGEYRGSTVKTFTIKPDKAGAISAGLSRPDEPAYYNVRGTTPDISVVVSRTEEGSETPNEYELVEGRDYKLTYSKNKKVGTGRCKVSFMNNYKGHKALTVTYTISPAPIDEARVEARDLVYGKPGKYRSAPYVSVGGVQLKKSDYSYKYYVDEKELGNKSKISLAADETEKTVTIVVTGKGNYSNGTVTGTYEVIRKKTGALNLNKAKIVAKEKNKKGKDVKVGKQEYTGYEIEPEIRVMVKVNKKWTDVDPSLYSVSYINNRNKGKATILVNGNGTETIGSKNVKFSITTMRMNWFKLIFGK